MARAKEVSELRQIGVVLALLALVAFGAAGGAAASQQVPFTILYTGDEHSSLLPHSPAVDYDPAGSDGTRGGFARLAGLIGQVRSQLEGPSLLLSSGDFIGGTMFSWLALEGYAPELELMRAMGYDAIAIGNHEFDYGPELLASYLAAAGYPGRDGPTLLAGNMVVPVGHPLAYAGIVRSQIVQLDGGPSVGLLGLLGAAALQVAPLVDPVTFDDAHTAARQLVDQLRAEGAQVIVAVTHAGLEEDRALAREVAGIDIIVGGHCHTALAQPVVEAGTIIVQAGAHTSNLGVLDLVFDPDTGAVSVANDLTGRPHLYPVDGDSPVDPELARLVDGYRVLISEYLGEWTSGAHGDILEPVARIGATVARAVRAESQLGNLMADATAWAAREAGHPVQFAFQANGQIRTDLVPGRRGATSELVSVYDVTAVASLGSGPGNTPGYPLVAVYLTGDELRRVMEISTLLSELLGDSYFLQVSGFEYTYDPDRPILMWLPVVNLPLPTYRSVLRVTAADGTAIQWGDQTLYGVAADLYVASMVPMVGELLPRLAIVPKDRHGNAIADLEQHIIYSEGQPLTAWRAALGYLGSMDRGPDGLPILSDTYLGEPARAERVRAFPLLVLVALAFVVALALATAAVYLVVRRIKRGRGRRAAAPGGGEPE